MKRLLALLLPLATIAMPARAQEREVPYWATIRESATKLNMRVGPSADYKVKWVYRRPGLPMQVVRVHEGWRLVRDPEGEQGWVVARLLDPDRGAIVIGEGNAAMRSDPAADAPLKWWLEPGVVGRLETCEEGWCRLSVGERSGWVAQSRLWGDDEP